MVQLYMMTGEFIFPRSPDRGLSDQEVINTNKLQLWKGYHIKT